MQWLNEVIGAALSAAWGWTLDGPPGRQRPVFPLRHHQDHRPALRADLRHLLYPELLSAGAQPSRILGRFHGIGANVLSALLGTVTPFCSCSSIPLFIGFTSAGLPLGVTFSFLISSPMVDLGSLVLLMSIFGAKVAVVYVVVGLVIAVAGGTIIEKLHMERYVEHFILSAGGVDIDLPHPDQTGSGPVRQGAGAVHLQKGVPLHSGGRGHRRGDPQLDPRRPGSRRCWAAAIPLGVVLATLVGVPMYADIFGTIPVAEALLCKGAQLGTILAFMMAVTTLSLPSLIMLRKAVKPKLLALFIGRLHRGHHPGGLSLQHSASLFDLIFRRY